MKKSEKTNNVTAAMYDTLLRPVITEKSMTSSESGKVVFTVPLNASKDDIKAAEDPVAKRQELIEEYRKQYQTPMYAAACGMIDDVITPDSTRARIISALEILSQKLV